MKDGARFAKHVYRRHVSNGTYLQGSRLSERGTATATPPARFRVERVNNREFVAYDTSHGVALTDPVDVFTATKVSRALNKADRLMKDAKQLESWAVRWNVEEKDHWTLRDAASKREQMERLLERIEGFLE